MKKIVAVIRDQGGGRGAQRLRRRQRLLHLHRGLTGDVGYADDAGHVKVANRLAPIIAPRIGLS